MSSKPSHRAWSPLQLRGTLAFRLSAAYSLAGLVLVVLATASLYVVLRAELDRSNELFLADKLNVLRTMLRERPDDEDGLREEIELESQARRYQRFYIRLIDEHGVTLMTTPGMPDKLDLAKLPGLSRGQHQRSATIVGRQRQSFEVTSAIVAVNTPATHTDTVQIAVDVSQEDELLGHYRQWFWGILLTTSVIFPLVGYQIARHGIRPVEDMGATARRITSTNLRERIECKGFPSELASLAATFNEMLQRLEESFDRISRFTADIAHDLRTPVNNIRGEAEVALARPRTAAEYRDVLESSLEEAIRLSELIGDLLFLARADKPLAELHREKVNAGELLTTVRDYYEASAADAGISLVLDNKAFTPNAELDRSLMLRAVSNLVSNAIAYTLPGGTVTLTTISKGDALRIEVFDTGLGIPAEALPRVFDRFFRVDQSRSKRSSGGTGLGLAIVQSILTLHGGSAEIVSELGRGTRVSLQLPLIAKTGENAERPSHSAL